MNIKNRKYFRYFLFLNNLNQYTKLQNLNKNGEVKKEFTYEYDNNGNLIKDDINQYFYDYKNRLVKVVQNEVVKLDENGNMIENIPEETIVEFTYDILGRRIQKKTENKTINYTYAGQNAIKEIITDKTTQEVTTRENIYSNNLDDILLTVVTKPDNTKTYQYYTKNHLNSIVAITDETGNILEEYIYDVFGKAYIRDGKSSNHREFKKSSLGVTRLYTGREYDYEPNLYFLRARYYSPDLGRFISRDPIDISDDLNLYSYVGNNSIMYTDPLGTEKKWIRENEGNAWYFDEVSSDNLVAHAGLYFIYEGQDYLLSYYPLNGIDPFTSRNGDIFTWLTDGQNTMGTYEKDIELIRNQLYGTKEETKNYIEIGNNNINAEKLFDWYKDEISDLPKYNTFTNNCSDEVEKALENAGFFTYTEFYGIPIPIPGNIGLPGTTPIGLMYDI